MSSISPDDIRWNDEARTKILEDSDRVLREAVLGVASTHADGSWEDAFAELNARLKDQFIDFEPGPDLRKYAEAIVAGEIDGAGGASSDADASSSDDSADAGSSDTATTDAAATGEERASDIAADAGASEPATPETDGSADEASTGTGDSDSSSDSDSDSDSGTEDPASGDTSDGNEAPNETIDDPSDPTVTDEPSA
ncbi:hypothetical protein CLV49_1356 [Labedella gwakjiensis]|uniref:Uncharacterized protein n=1 Tax=Labedella gwakjiensis TaxID=390269 RepID=A0A2P8GUV4_9MICO|nr:hypothetical protein [Labedella gwakjiensis]PSL37749.1 hypothetical protein CLV49_1356 [Labedella gwakjiensis]